MLGLVSPSLLSNVSKQALISIVKLKAALQRSQLPDETAPGGPCLPGATRFPVDCDGNFFPCERVSEHSCIMNIGHIDSGFDYEKAMCLLNVAQCTEESCKDCWAIIHCTLCARQCDGGNCLISEKRLNHCDNVRFDVEQNMRMFLAIDEVKKKYGHLINYKV